MAKKPTAKVVAFPRAFAVDRPDDLGSDDALRIIKALATDSKNILVVEHAKLRQRQRHITRPQIERCIQKGVITEGPFLNAHGHWQVNLTRYAADEVGRTDQHRRAL